MVIVSKDFRMKRYFNVTKIKWGKYLHKCSWHEIHRDELPSEQNFLTLEDIHMDIYKALCDELTATYGYEVESIEFIEMSEEEADKQALFILLSCIS